ncbi:heparanase isoform X3 [Penaeus vannamei]
MASLSLPQARVFVLLLACLAPSVGALGEQKPLDAPAGCSPLLSATRDAKAAQKELSSLLQIASKDASLDAKKLERTLFFVAKRWAHRLEEQVRRARRECGLHEGLLEAYLRGGGGGGTGEEEEEEGRRENEIRRGRRGRWRFQTPEKAHKRETDPEERAREREREREATPETWRELLTRPKDSRDRGITQRSLTKLLVKILGLGAEGQLPGGGGGGREPTLEDDPRPRLEVDEEEVVHEVPRTFLSLALGSSLIQHHWKKFDTKSPLLLTLTRALSPAVLRMGGSSANFLTYDPQARSRGSRDEEEEEVEEETINEGVEKEVGENNGFYRRTKREVRERTGRNKEFVEERHNEGEEEGETPINAPTQLPEEYEDEGEYEEDDYEEEEEGERETDSKKTGMAEEIENGEEMADCECGSTRQIFTNFTMTARDWRLLQDFARDAKMSLLFDVNQFYRRGDGRVWDPENVRLILRDVEEERGTGDLLWQLGNEPNAYNHKFSLRIPPNQTAEDYLLLQQELDRRFPHAGVVGPDVTRPKKMNRKLALKMSSVDYLASFLSTVKINLTAVTWHQYYVNGRTATLEKFLAPEVFDQLIWQVEEVVRVRDQLTPNTPVWLTETSSAWGGGAPGLSNAFVGGFMWLDKLGVAARGGISLVARQTLYDGCYALLDRDLNPYPDYWLSVLFKRLVGGRVLSLTTHEAPKTVRLYAHCYNEEAEDHFPGSVVIYGENLGPFSVTVDLEGRLKESPVLRYLLEAPKGELRSRNVMLNGQRLRVTSSNELPTMHPRAVSRGALVLPPTALGFWVFPHAHLPACL